MKQYCYVNGKIILTSQAALPVMDVSILRGYAVFDVLRTYNGKPFLWDLHWKRLIRSAKALRLQVPLSSDQAYKIVTQLHKKNKLSESNIRILVGGGVSADGFTFNPKTPSVVILITPFVALPQRIFASGAKLITYEHLREEYPSKTTNYITAVKMKAECIKKGALEILYTHNNQVLEAATSNFFIVKNNTIVTPKDRILEGITRNFVIKLAKKHYTVIEAPITLRDVKTADEAFLTATNKDIVPIVHIDNMKVGNGKVGTVTTHLMELFESEIYKKAGH